MSRGGLPPHAPDVAVRIIYWPPPATKSCSRGRSDKKSIGDVFYASVTARGAAIADA